MKRALLVFAALPLLTGAAKPRAEKAPDPKLESEHVVKAGETLAGIAVRAEVPRVLIIEANGLKKPFQVNLGQTLIIPRRRSHTVKAGETGFSIAYEYDVPWKVIATASGVDPKAKVKAGQKLVIPTLSKPGIVKAAASDASDDKAKDKAAKDTPVQFAWPLAGDVRREFAPRGKKAAHDGIDIAGKEGTPVRASAGGTVAFAGVEPKSFGLAVIVDHGKGWFTAYGKLQKVKVKKGAKVRAGEVVGLLGHSGSTPETELHFEIRRKTVPVDPLEVLPERD